MEKNIFLCHGDINLFYKTISEISLNEDSINFIGLFSLGQRKIYNTNKLDTFTFHDFINFREKYNISSALTPNEIKYFRKECFYDFLSQTDRLSIKPTSNTEKIKLFDLFINFFLEYFKKKNYKYNISYNPTHGF